MSVHFDVSKISFFGLDDWSVAVCAWRGCCIQVFSRAEHSVADCIEVLRTAGLSLSKDAFNPFAGNRIKALRNCIAQHGFGGHGKVALERIAAWERLYEARAHLAHGIVKATPDGISVTHITFDGKAETQHPAKNLTRFEMLEMLADIEAAQKSLHGQLGQIKALAAKAKPVPSPKPSSQRKLGPQAAGTAL
ncbi:hypothetical protein [uncultured Erythrobacter sp.]|uniref:hypothetical protein n=1 Tax=uncultured Erythrobacter sp. TaxID=263913 RepID=UPI0026599985|nr:hypothetical protein [uncultured Erythrobacter sp.]